jgi:hypothetical protein
MVNFPDLPQVPQWLKDLLGDTSASGNRGFYAGSHMMAGGTDYFELLYERASVGWLPTHLHPHCPGSPRKPSARKDLADPHLRPRRPALGVDHA